MPATSELVNACVSSFLQHPLIRRFEEYLDRHDAETASALRQSQVVHGPAVMGAKHPVTPKRKPEPHDDQELDPEEVARATTQYALNAANQGKVVSYGDARKKVVRRMTGGKRSRFDRAPIVSEWDDAVARYSQAHVPPFSIPSQNMHAAAIEQSVSSPAAKARADRAVELVYKASLRGEKLNYSLALDQAIEELG